MKAEDGKTIRRSAIWPTIWRKSVMGLIALLPDSSFIAGKIDYG
jgi:hypothetical protein